MNFKLLITLLVFILFIVLAVESNKSGPSTTNSSDVKISETEKINLEMLDCKWTNKEYNSFITGRVQNKSEKTVRYAQISFNLFDDSGAQVGTAMANINNLAPSGIWKFEAIVMNDNVAKYKLAELNGF